VALAGPLTLVHGDAAAQNFRTAPDGEIAFLDWEDVSTAPAALDLAWLLVSSVEPVRWSDVIAAYGSSEGLINVMPAVMVQGLLTMADVPVGSAQAAGWNDRLKKAVLLRKQHRG
jgi:aminoglycoside phosphotransferase (APT) family kinase protein